MRTNMKGDIAELAVAKKFLEMGYWVSFPYSDDSPYDILVDDGINIKKIQVKYLTQKKNVLKFLLHSNTGISYKNTVDYMVLYDSISKNVYMIDPRKFGNKAMIQLRLNEPQNNQKKGVHLAENYLI